MNPANKIMTYDEHIRAIKQRVKAYNERVRDNAPASFGAGVAYIVAAAVKKTEAARAASNHTNNHS